MAFIEFADVSKHYPGNTAPSVERLNLRVERGEFLTLLGPSGSGKTTCLMMLAGFESVSSGRILLDGQEIEEWPAHKRNMGIVFQSYSLFPHMTVAGNVAFPLQVRKVGSAETAERVRRALERVHLGDFAHRRPNQLSGGQQQRVALARALVFEPSLVLMDEPLAALDKRLREEMQLEIRRLHRDLGVTMVFVTHDQSEAMTLSDRVAVFNRGRVEQLDTPQTLYDAPANPFVAGFLGDNNRIVGRLQGRCGDGFALVEPAGAGVTLSARCSAALAAALAPGGTAPAQATLCVRPERLHLLAPDAREGVPATVVDLIHQGDHWRMLARPALAGTAPDDGAAQWLVKLSPSALPGGMTRGQEWFPSSPRWRWVRQPSRCRPAT
jgi:putative spermidine/putrescine transport system ATP-binding protein